MRRAQWWLAIAVAAAGVWLPLPLLASIVIAYTSAHPKKWLLLLAAVSELLTALPFGILTLAVFIPWLVRRWTTPQEPTLTMSFLGLLIGIAALQYLTLASFDVMREASIPWAKFTIGLLITSFTAFGFFAIRNLFRPSLV